MRDILVRAAFRDSTSSENVKRALLAGHITIDDIMDIDSLADLGRLILLQDLLEDDRSYGEKLLMMAYDLAEGDISLVNRRILTQHLILTGDVKEAQRLLDASPDLEREYFGYLRGELANPYTHPDGADFVKWWDSFNDIFRSYQLSPIELIEKSGRKPFDQLIVTEETRNRTTYYDERLVSIVLTAFRPNEAHILTSVNSILKQTWRNLEVIVVNDCSGPEYDRIFTRLAELDQRVKVLHLEQNQGTYVARNHGYSAARGVFITGQDDDDWSHPERIERQVKFLDSNPNLIGCRVTGLMCDEDLGRVRLGYKPINVNASSLMIRREGYEVAGDFLLARKAADTEYFFRVQKVTGKKIKTVEVPLTVVRILSDSLSRGDFGPGWRHSSRRSFRSSYLHWHDNYPVESLRLSADDSPPVKIPRRFQITVDSPSDNEFDVVFAGDWQSNGGPQKSMLEEIRALTQANYRIGIMNLEAARFMKHTDVATLNEEIQELINNGVVDEVHYSEAAKIRLLVLRYPPILQFFTQDVTNLQINKMIILANQAPAELDGTDIRYLVDECHKNAERAFKVSPVWVPQGPQVRHYLEHYISMPELATFDIPGILDVDDWWSDKVWFRSTIPVVGRHSRDDAMKWPADKNVIENVYPTGGKFDIRIMGGVKSPLKVLGVSDLPAGWTAYKKNELPVRDFLHSLDYFVFYPHPKAVEAFGRSILEAMASGLVVILPEKFRQVFGDTAVYSEPEDVEEWITYFHNDFDKYQQQLRQTRSRLAKAFSYESYRARIKALIS